MTSAWDCLIQDTLHYTTLHSKILYLWQNVSDLGIEILIFSPLLYMKSSVTISILLT